jgi:ribulose-5-phosphate 4-epimerase/fuculose-1-phosphate aldolase
MIQEKAPNFNFQSFYISNETCNCPLITEIIKANKKLRKIELLKDNIDISISIKYGRRVLINAKNIDLLHLSSEDFLEIVDYDPLKRVLLLIGPKEPLINTPIHWLIHHARDEVKAIIQIDKGQLTEKINKKYPITEKEYQKGTLEQAKEILLQLRNSKIVIIKNQGIIFVGDSMKNIEDSVIRTFEESK